MMPINAKQCRMARAALQIGVRELANHGQGRDRARFSVRGRGNTQPRTLEAIQHALEKAGIEFIDGNKPGVRVK